MRLMYFGLVLLLSWEIKNVCCHVSNSGSGSPPRSNSGFQSSFFFDYNPCDKEKVKTRESDMHSTCRNECLALTTEISSIYKSYAGNTAVQFLHSRCGMVTDGQCGTGPLIPVCLCHTPNSAKGHKRTTFLKVPKVLQPATTPKSEQRTLVQFCRHGLQLTQTFISARITTWAGGIFSNRAKEWTDEQEVGSHNRRDNGREPTVEEVGMFACCGRTSAGDRTPTRPRTPRNRPKIPSVPRLSFKREDETKQFQGRVLIADVLIADEPVIAVIDTGSSITSIHPNLADDTEDYHGQPLFTGDRKQLDVKWTTTIDVEITGGIIISLKGLVTQLTPGILLGNDFFRAHAAKIKILKSQMEITVDGTRVAIPTRFGTMSDVTYTLIDGTAPPVFVSIPVNGAHTQTIVDTGSTITHVNKHLVKQKIRTDDSTIFFGTAGTSQATRFEGNRLIDLQFESKTLTFTAFVPRHKHPVHLVLGNDFNSQYVDEIDYESKNVVFRFAGLVRDIVIT